MQYQDILYGSITIASEIVKLFPISALRRLRGISQYDLPVELAPFSSAGNRFQHGIGVMYLLERLIGLPWIRYCLEAEGRTIGVDLGKHLLVAGLFHDAGNPPFSHSGDNLLRWRTGLHGEDHLMRVLQRDGSERELERYGVVPSIVCDFVAGRWKPYSLFLNGSVDADNIDNIARYLLLQGLSVSYDPCRFIEAFRLSHDGEGEESVEFSADAKKNLEGWVRDRIRVYQDLVYADPCLAAQLMLDRLLWLANEVAPISLDDDFFFMTDRAAFRYLEVIDDESCRSLTEKILGMQYFESAVLCRVRERPRYADSGRNEWEQSNRLADTVAREFGLKRWQVTAHVGRGAHVKKSLPPIREVGGTILQMTLPSSQAEWRINIYVPPEEAPRVRNAIKDPLRYVERALASP